MFPTLSLYKIVKVGYIHICIYMHACIKIPPLLLPSIVKTVFLFIMQQYYYLPEVKPRKSRLKKCCALSLLGEETAKSMHKRRTRINDGSRGKEPKFQMLVTSCLSHSLEEMRLQNWANKNFYAQATFLLLWEKQGNIFFISQAKLNFC